MKRGKSNAAVRTAGIAGPPSSRRLDDQARGETKEEGSEVQAD